MPKDIQTQRESGAPAHGPRGRGQRGAGAPDGRGERASAGAAGDPFPMRRPALLARAACTGAAAYARGRDLPGAVPGLLAQPGARILAKLAEAEARCEAARRERAPGYRPARHVQVLAALIAETRAAREAPGPAAADQPKASGSSALRRAT